MICAPCGTTGIRRIRALKAHLSSCPAGRGGWAHVVHLKQTRKWDEAAEVARGLMGIEAPKMTEEQKEYLREYSKTPEAKARAKANRETRVAKARVARMLERRQTHAGETAHARKSARQVKRKA